ncbi:MAG: hypothetical protein Q4G39_04745, partial [Brachymonas sp.]|nr:hypothetical protein [Brachymonas sp.]
SSQEVSMWWTHVCFLRPYENGKVSGSILLLAWLPAISLKTAHLKTKIAYSASSTSEIVQQDKA